jgi:thiamine-monophosphate kinase
MIFTQANERHSCPSETELIHLIKIWLGAVNPAYPNGIGDDCAIVKTPQSQQLLTTDSLTYGKHFDHSISAEAAGEKLVKRNISDIAAMGGTPKYALLNLMCAPNISIRWLEDFFKGIRQCCEKYEIQLVGGDISGLDENQFSASITLTGICVKPKLRQTAQVGDKIFVTGSLGGSLLGKHSTFDPRLTEGKWLAQRSEVTAMMDLTDGLAKDLNAMLPPGTSASINLENVPLSLAAHKTATESGRPALAHAFQDGEDYELLFTVKPMQSDFVDVWTATFPELPIHQIGKIIPAVPNGVYVDASTLEALPWTHGYEHLIP